MKYLEKVTKIQAEISNFCNATCIGCRRVDHKTLTTKYEIVNTPTSFLSLDIIEKCISDPILDSITEFEFCGTIDEPFAHPKFLEILDVLYKHRPNMFIRIHTNGAIRDSNFYKQLAESLLRFKKHEVRFALDGLKESHRLYRDIDFDKIVENATVFISSNGYATWQMLEFPWNSHEVSKCEEMATMLKFKRFVVRRDRTISSTIPVETIKNLRNNKTLSVKKVRDTTYRIPDEDKEISCHFQKEGMVFLDWEGTIHPCCFMANPKLTRVAGKDVQLEEVFSKFEDEFNSLKKHTLTEILEHKWYSNDLVDSWNNSFKDNNPKLLFCHYSCGKGMSVPKGEHLQITGVTA